VLVVRFLADIAPGKWLLTRHRGSNRLPEERKTDAETSGRATNGKTKERVFSGKARVASRETAESSPQSRFG